jgi:hypothetical protein
MTILGPAAAETHETRQGTDTGPFFVDLVHGISRQAAALQGRHLPVHSSTADIEETAFWLNTALEVDHVGERGEPQATSLVMHLAGRPRVPKMYATPLTSPAGQRATGLRIPSSAITAVSVNVRMNGGPGLHTAIANAQEALATDPNYTTRHEGRACCAETHCLCHLAAVNPARVRADVSPVLDLRISSPDDTGVRVYKDQRLAEELSPGRWFRFPLAQITHLDLIRLDENSADVPA